MKERLIEQYVSRMTINDVSNFAVKNGVNLNQDEVEMLYNKIVNNWKTIVFGNPRGLLDELKEKLDLQTYQKIENLYIYFKDKFKSNKKSFRENM